MTVRIKRLVRQVARITLMFLAGLLFFLTFMIATPIGNKGVFAIANNRLTALNIEHESGSLASTLKIKQLTWQADGIDASIANLSLSIDWQCVADRRFCIEQIASPSVSVNIVPTTEKTIEPETQPSLITLPIGFSIDTAKFDNINLAIKETVNLTLSQLDTSISMHEKLNVSHFSWKSLAVVLPQEETPAPTNQSFNINDIANWQYVVPELPPLFFPIIGDFNTIQLGTIEIIQGQAQLVKIESIKTQASINEKQLNIQQLEVNHTLGQLVLTASLSDTYEHQLKLDISTELEQQPLTARITSNGLPSDLNLSVDTQGVISSTLIVNANIMDPQLPLSTALSWQNVRWPVSSESVAQYQSEQGSLSIQGTIQRYQAMLNTQIDGDAIPTTELSLTLTGNQRESSLEELLINTLGGQFITSGKLVLDEALQWTGSLAFNDIQPQALFPQLDAKLSGQSEYSARFDNKNYRANLNHMEMTGEWQEYDIKAIGTGTFDSQTGLNLPLFNVAIGDNSIDAEATLTQEQVLDAKLIVNATDLEQLLPTLGGQIQAKSQLSGSLTEPKVQFEMEAQSLVFDTVSIESIKATGGTTWSNDPTIDKPINVQLLLQEMSVAGQSIETADFYLAGTTKAHVSNLSLIHDKATFNTKLTGSLDLDLSQWDGQWSQGQVLSDVASFSIGKTQPKILLSWQENKYLLSKHCWTDNQAKLCFNDARFDKGQANLDIGIQQLPVFSILQQVVPDLANIQSSTRLNATVTASLKDSHPTVNLNAELTPAQWSMGDDSQPFDVEQFTIEAMIDKQKADGRLSLVSEQLGQIALQMTINELQADRQVNGNVKLTAFDLSYFQPLAPQLTQLNGLVNANINVFDELTNPKVRGELNLHNGTIAGPLLPSKISQINQVIQLEGESASLSGSYLFGAGQGQVNGQINWQDEPTGNVAIRGENMEIEHQNLIKAKISPDIMLTFSKEDLSIKGDLSVPYARIKVRELPPSALSPSDDTVIVNQEPEEASPIKSLDLDLQIHLDQAKANDVKVDAFGLTSNLQGHLLVTQNGGAILGDGQLNLVEGHYRAYGQDLTIRKGEVQFNGPVDSPFVNIEAIRNPEKTADEVIAGLRVEGPSQQPDITVFSVPELEQPEALSYLLRGQSISDTGGAGGGSGTALTNALIGFGLSKSENKVTKLGSKLGIDDFALATTGQGIDTKVAVSGSIAKGVQLRYGVGVFDSASEVALRYQLWPKLYLEAVSGLNNALDIYYQFNIEGKKTTLPTEE
jgi:translocation and assembly module TamB